MRLATEVKSAADSADEDRGDSQEDGELLMSDSSFMSLDRPEDKADQKVDEELMAGKLECFLGGCQLPGKENQRSLSGL